MSNIIKTAFLFPGQGSQQPGMLDQFSADADFAPVFSAAESILHKKISAIDTPAGLSSTINVQMSLLLAGVASAKKLLAKGVRADFVAGHSVGAFAAAVISEVITFEQALNLVYNRARLMEEAFPTGYGMAALVGFTQSRLAPYLEKHNQNQPTVYLSNINAADQLVVAGKTSSIEVLMEELQKSGIQKTKMLDVKVPSHCPLMSGVSDALKEQVESIGLKKPAIPYASNTTGRLLNDAEMIGRDLWQSISSPVKWDDATTLIYEKGARLFIEMEPSGVLAKIAASTFPDAETLTVNEGRADQLAAVWNKYQQTK